MQQSARQHREGRSERLPLEQLKHVTSSPFSIVTADFPGMEAASGLGVCNERRSALLQQRL
jgi:hypothetical protein